jgi:uncharacterized membrane protein
MVSGDQWATETTVASQAVDDGASTRPSAVGSDGERIVAGRSVESSLNERIVQVIPPVEGVK